MSVFLGTLIIIGVCCLVMSFSLLISGKPLHRGCGSKLPGAPRCEGCPKRNHRPQTPDDPEGESL